MKLKIILIALVLFALFPRPTLPVSAQGGDPLKLFAGPDSRFSHISTEQGLSSRDVWDIVRDHHGFMWFGTLDGLNRFDGYGIKVYKHDLQDPYSLSENTIRKLYVDQAGVLWIGTWTGGLDRFDPETEKFTHFRHNPADPASLSSDSVYAILQDRTGILWFGTRDGGLNRFDAATQTFTHFVHNPDDPTSISNDSVFEIMEDDKGSLWISTNGGLNRFDPATETFTAFTHDPSDPASLSLDQVRGLFLDQEGMFWVGTYAAGLGRFEVASVDRLDPTKVKSQHLQNESNNLQSLSGTPILTILGDTRGRIWVGTFGGGLIQYDPTRGAFRYAQDIAKPAGAFQADSVHRIVQVGDMVWFGTSNGVYSTNLRAKPFYSLVHDPNDPNTIAATEIDAVYADSRGILWVATDGTGLNKVDLNTGVVTHYRHDADNPNSLSWDTIWKISPSRDGGLWLATWGGGLDKFDHVTEKFTHYRNDPANPDSLSTDFTQSAYQDTEGIVWVGTWGGGLERLDPETGKFTHFRHDPKDPNSIVDDWPNWIYQDRDGELWAGTTNEGLERVDRKNGTFAHFLTASQDGAVPGVSNISAITEDKNRNLWIGTWNAGLFQLAPDRTLVRRYVRKDGLPSDSVFGILEDARGQLWISTNNGLSRFNPEEGTFRNFDARDGLPGNAFEPPIYSQGANGEMFFGGKDGLVAFFPDEIHDNSAVPPVVLTDLQLNNKPVPIGADSVLKQSLLETQELTLSYQDRVITFEMAALGFVAPQKNRYRYMLEGFDPTWTEVGSDRRLVTYTNLDPGVYTFRVIASNSDGIWDEQGTSLRLVVTPPWWETNWFRGALGLLALGLVVGGFVWQRADARRRERQLEMQVTERTQSLRFAQDQINAMFQNSPLGIILAKFDGTILAANPAILQMLGYTEAELLALNARALYRNPAQRTEILQGLESAHSVNRRDAEIVRKDGKGLIGNVNMSLLRRADQDILLGVFEDITELLEAEHVLRESEMQKAEQIAVDAERNRLARELHDSVSQSLYTSALISEALPAVWDKHPDEARQSLQQLHQLNQNALEEMRALLLELHPQSISDRPLGDLLRQLTTTLSTRTQLNISTTVAGTCELPSRVHVAFYRIAQEALNNIVKHARASQVYVNLNCNQARASLRITDNGAGFQENHDDPQHMGILIMRERAQAAGVTLTITSHPGSGTTVAAEWMDPLSETETIPAPLHD